MIPRLHSLWSSSQGILLQPHYISVDVQVPAHTSTPRSPHLIPADFPIPDSAAPS